MLPRIQNALNEFLKPFDLDMSSYIFEDSIPLLAHLEIDELEKGPFRFMRKLDGAGCRFSTSKLDEVNKSKLIHFCGMTEANDPPRKDFKSDAEIQDAYQEYDDFNGDYEDAFQISEAYLEKTIIPLFHNFIRTLPNTNPDFLIQYQTISRRAFEEQALKEIKKYSLLLLKELNEKTELSAQEFSFQSLITKLIDERKLIRKNYYSYSPREFLLLRKILDNFNQFHIEIENAVLNSHLSQYAKNIECIADNLRIFLRVSRIEAHLNWLMLCTALNACLLDVKISIHDCDIFEHTLLALAEIPVPKLACSFDMDRDNISCLSLYIPDLSLVNAEKLLAFFHQHGAASAKIKKSCYEMSEYGPRRVDRDGRAYWNHAVPGVRYTINLHEVLSKMVKLFFGMITDIKIKNSSIFLPYQERSKRRFKEEVVATPQPLNDNFGEVFNDQSEVKEPPLSTSQIFQALNASPAAAINMSVVEEKEVTKIEEVVEVGRRGGPPKIPPVFGNPLRIYHENPEAKRDKNGIYTGISMEELEEIDANITSPKETSREDALNKKDIFTLR